MITGDNIARRAEYRQSGSRIQSVSRDFLILGPSIGGMMRKLRRKKKRKTSGWKLLIAGWLGT